MFQDFRQKPLSRERIASYQNNPNAKPDDVVLYMLTDEKKLVAYRSVLPDYYYGKETEHFAWLSGNWVHPDYRRKGLSRQLLDAVMKDWNGRLMYSNYAPESHALYQKSGKFHLISHREGYGFYLYAKPSRLYRQRVKKPWWFFLHFGDMAFALVAAAKRLVYSAPSLRLQVDIKSKPDEEFYRLFADRHMLGFERGKNELEWIINHPWISHSKQNQAYYFSHRAKQFFYRFLVLKDKGEACGLAMLQYRDGRLQVPYFQVSKGGHEELAAWLIRYCRKKHVQYMIIYDPVLSEALAMHGKQFVYHKSKAQNIYASWQPSGYSPLAYDGDGDYVFS